MKYIDQVNGDKVQAFRVREGRALPTFFSFSISAAWVDEGLRLFKPNLLVKFGQWLVQYKDGFMVAVDDHKFQEVFHVAVDDAVIRDLREENRKLRERLLGGNTTDTLDVVSNLREAKVYSGQLEEERDECYTTIDALKNENFRLSCEVSTLKGELENLNERIVRQRRTIVEQENVLETIRHTLA